MALTPYAEAMRSAQLVVALLLLAVSSACHHRVHWGGSYGASAPVRQVLVAASDAATGWSQPANSSKWESDASRFIQHERYTLEFQMSPRNDGETESIFRALTGALHKDLFGVGYDKAGAPEFEFDRTGRPYIGTFSAPFTKRGELQPVTCDLRVWLRHVGGNDYELTVVYEEITG